MDRFVSPVFVLIFIRRNSVTFSSSYVLDALFVMLALANDQTSAQPLVRKRLRFYAHASKLKSFLETFSL